MTDPHDYAVLDQPQVLNCLFHPRKEGWVREKNEAREDVIIPVGDQVSLGASFHFSGQSDPFVLFFHGNGEIVSDYDDFGLFYTRKGLNLFVADYRGYGSSSGTPTVASMMSDCHKVLDYVIEYRSERGLTGPLCVMGRSLGSASAIELAAARQDEFDCLIIESGFAFASPLLYTLGIDPEQIGFKEQQGFENIDKIKTFSKPCLVIHAEFDHIIPFSDGRALFEACPSDRKALLEIKGANHNDLFFKDMNRYLEQVKQICTL